MSLVDGNEIHLAIVCMGCSYLIMAIYAGCKLAIYLGLGQTISDSYSDIRCF